jgi:hypothetical protein
MKQRICTCLVVLVLLAMAGSSQANLLVNGDFSGAQYTNYSGTSNVQSTTISSAGVGKWLAWSVTGATPYGFTVANGNVTYSGATGSNRVAFAQAISLSTLTTSNGTDLDYKVAFDTTSSGSMFSGRLYAILCSSSASIYAYANDPVYNAPTNAGVQGYVNNPWITTGTRTKSYELTFNISAAEKTTYAGGYLVIAGNYSGNGNTGTLSFDNFNLTGPVPEPATLAILGLGGLMLRRSRK